MKKIFILILAIICSLNMVSAQNPTTDYNYEVYPPNWWTNMKTDTIELMFYGEAIGGYKINIQSTQVRLLGASTLPNPNYLLVKLDVSNLKNPEKMKMTFFKKEHRFIHYFEFKERKPYSHKRWGVSSQDVVYQIIIDRFCNGTPENDTIKGFLDNEINPDSALYRHGGDLIGIENNIEYLTQLGVTALQLGQVLESNQASFSYLGQGITNHYLVDARLGSNQDLINLVQKCHQNNLKVLLNLNFNHQDKNHWLQTDLPFDEWNKNTDKSRPSNYHVTTLLDEHAANHDKFGFTNGVINANWPELNFSTDFITKFYIQNTVWLIENFDLDGIFVDFYTHADQHFMRDWAAAITAEYPKIKLFGEVESNLVAIQSFFTKGGTGSFADSAFVSNLHGITDYPVYQAIQYILANNTNQQTALYNLYNTLAQDFLYHDASQNLIFFDHLNSNRFFTQVDGSIEKYKMAVGLLLTLRGIPQINYGTEVLIPNASWQLHPAHANFSGGINVQSQSKFTEQGRTELENEAFNFFKTLANYRQNSIVLKEGLFQHFVPQNGVYVYFRYRKEGTVMVLLNNNDEAQNISTARFSERLTGFEYGYDVITGKTQTGIRTFDVAAKSIRIIELR